MGDAVHGDRAKGDEYFIQVQTDNGGGQQPLRAARRDTAATTPAPVTIAGNTYMGMYANVGSNQLTKFYLVRVPSAAKGHTLVLNFYDIGDANSHGLAAGRAAARQQHRRRVPDNGCTWTGDTTDRRASATRRTRRHAPWGRLTGDHRLQDHRRQRRTASWNAQWSTVTVPIPSNYTCNDADPNGCWLTINYLFAGEVHDVTSWTAALLGDPVRLVK